MHTYPAAAARTDEDAVGWFLARWLLARGWKTALRDREDAAVVEVPVSGQWAGTSARQKGSGGESIWDISVGLVDRSRAE